MRYEELPGAWEEAIPWPPLETPEEAASLVFWSFNGTNYSPDFEVDSETPPPLCSCSHHMIHFPFHGTLAFYDLPSPQTPVETFEASSSLPDGVKFVMHTLPVDAKDVGDGDGLTVYVDIKDPRESANVPLGIHQAAISRSRARATKNYSVADAIHKRIIDAGYRVIKGPNNEEILAKKYRIRLRGIDAPERPMPYGKEAKDELVKLVRGKSLEIHAYGQDKYGRCVGDVYYDGAFVQEQMLKRGCAWHYTAHDKRRAFSKWEKAAREARRGLWALPHPEKPWKWRKNRGNDAWRAHPVPLQPMEYLPQEHFFIGHVTNYGNELCI